MSRVQFSSLKKNDGIHFYLKGELTRENLSSFIKTSATEIEKLLSKSSIIFWHFAELNHIDSAGFAFLCDLLKKGEQAKSQKIVDYPDAFLTLASLFGLKKWLTPLTF